MAWFLEDAFGLVVAGPFEYRSSTIQWVIEHPARTKDLLTAIELQGVLELIAITDSMTPALQDLQASGDIVCVCLPFGFTAVYSV